MTRLFNAAAAALLALVCFALPVVGQELHTAPYGRTIETPHVANNTALVAAGIAAYPQGVWRDRITSSHPAIPVFFTPLTGTCTTNSLAPDGFRCVNNAEGNAWRGSVPASLDGDPDYYGAIHDSGNHPLSAFPTLYPDLATTALICPDIQFLAGYTTAASTTNAIASITFTGTYKPYVVPGQHITGTNIPASTYIGTMNYATGVATLVQSDRTTAQNATGTGAGIDMTVSFDVTWSAVQVDWCAFQAAVNAQRVTGGASGLYKQGIKLASGGSYRFDHGLNLTCLSTPTGSGTSNCSNTATHGSTIIDFNGASVFFTNMSTSDWSGAGIDMMGSNTVTLMNGSVYSGDGGFCNGSGPVKRGVQMGRAVGTGGSTNMLRNMFFKGEFQVAAFYNLASEGSGTEMSIFYNCDTTGNAFVGMYDGGAHYVPKSNYTAITAVQDVPLSMNDSWDKDSVFAFYSSGVGSPLFVYGGRGLNLDQTYFIAQSAPCITLFSGTSGGGDAASITQMPRFNIHCEGTFADLVSVVSRSAGGTPTITGMTITDHVVYPTTNIFKLGTNTTSVTLANPAIQFPRSVSSPNLFDTPASWTIQNPTKISVVGSTIVASITTVTVVTAAGNGTYTPTPGARNTCVIAIGAGGAGGGGAQTASGTAASGGAGGGGGGRAEQCFVTSDLGASIAYTVGTAGTGGTPAGSSSTAGGNGSAGTRTNFGPNVSSTTLTAVGGGGGAGGQINAAAGAPAGGGVGWNCGTSASSTTNSTSASANAPCQAALVSGAGLLEGTGAAGGSGTNGAAGAQGGFAAKGPSGGGAGGGLAATPANTAGGNSGANAFLSNVAGGTAGNNAGTAGRTTAGLNDSGTGGGGGGAAASGNSASGGVGGQCGGGGGGAGSSINGGTPGTGGNGGAGCIIIREFF